MQNNQVFLNEYAKKIEPYVGEIPDEKVEELEWFMKLEAVRAINQENKEEFNYILQNNDMQKFVEFFVKYVPDFQNKLIKFMEEN